MTHDTWSPLFLSSCSCLPLLHHFLANRIGEETRGTYRSGQGIQELCHPGCVLDWSKIMWKCRKLCPGLPGCVWAGRTELWVMLPQNRWQVEGKPPNICSALVCGRRRAIWTRTAGPGIIKRRKCWEGRELKGRERRKSNEMRQRQGKLKVFNNYWNPD